MRVFLSSYIKPLGFPDDARFILLRSTLFNTEVYQQFIERQPESSRRPIHSSITLFFRWLLNEYCTDEDSGERIVLEEFRNPFDTVMLGYGESLQASRPNQSTKPALGYEYILRARRYLVPKGEDALRTRPDLKSLPHLQSFFDSRADWMDVDEDTIDRSDPNCVWRLNKNAYRVVGNESRKITVYQIWCPARFIALYTLLRFPLRGQQIMWLDSGESDKEIPVLSSDAHNVTWTANTSPLARMGSRKKHQQGVVQKGDNEPTMYVTTNKTKRTEGGYFVDWLPDDLVYWFIVLREWQSKYNPLRQPVPWSCIGSLNTNKKILKARGTQCFLFRDRSGKPLSKSVFELMLPALLFKIQRPGESLASDGQDPLLISYTSSYTPHSLRVSLITAFVVDGGAPIHVISKLVGHTSLVMTIYYVKMNSNKMRTAMSEAEKRADLLTTNDQCENIRVHGPHPLRDMLIAADGNRSLIGQDVHGSACVVFDWGICPMSAAACHMGTSIQVANQKAPLYGPVESGYLGQKNCLRCRFFVTGVPFMGGLVALANELALEVHSESGRFQNFAKAVVKFEEEHFDACFHNLPDTGQNLRKLAIANEQQSGAKLDNLITDYAAINRYVQGCLQLINDPLLNSDIDDRDIRLITSEESKLVVSIEESKSQYHLLAEICQNATIYSSTNPSRAIPLISQAIDRMAENNNLKPAMFRLDDEQTLVVANELNKFLLQRLGSWERIDNLFSGELMLLDLDADCPELTRLSSEVENLLCSRKSRLLDLARADTI